MDTAPIDSYDGAADIFTFGGGSLGRWLFLILAFLLFVGMIVRLAVHEGAHLQVGHRKRSGRLGGDG